MEKLDKTRLVAAAETLMENFVRPSDPWVQDQRIVQHFTDEAGEKFTMMVVMKRFDDRPIEEDIEYLDRSDES